jgi:hypothetical protein
MKNEIILNLDTERNPMIQFNKPESYPRPTSRDEMHNVLINDIALLSESLTVLIKRADEYKYGKKEDLIKAAIDTLNSLLNNNDVQPIE